MAVQFQALCLEESLATLCLRISDLKIWKSGVFEADFPLFWFLPLPGSRAAPALPRVEYSIFGQRTALHYPTITPSPTKQWPIKKKAEKKMAERRKKNYLGWNPTPRIPNSCSCSCCVTKSVKWRYLGNQAWYHSSAGVKKDRENILNKKIKKKRKTKKMS